LLFRTEIGSRKDFLHTKHLHALGRGFLDEAQMLLNIESLDVVDR
jgi:hypothetical protein